MGGAVGRDDDHAAPAIDPHRRRTLHAAGVGSREKPGSETHRVAGASSAMPRKLSGLMTAMAAALMHHRAIGRKPVSSLNDGGVRAAGQDGVATAGGEQEKRDQHIHMCQISTVPIGP